MVQVGMRPPHRRLHLGDYISRKVMVQLGMRPPHRRSSDPLGRLLRRLARARAEIVRARAEIARARAAGATAAPTAPATCSASSFVTRRPRTISARARTISDAISSELAVARARPISDDLRRTSPRPKGVVPGTRSPSSAAPPSPRRRRRAAAGSRPTLRTPSTRSEPACMQPALSTARVELGGRARRIFSRELAPAEVRSGRPPPGISALR